MKNNGIIFCGRSNPQLGYRINEILGIKPGAIKISNFSDGEITVKLEDNIRGKDVFIIQSTNPPAENILELLLIIDAPGALLPVELPPFSPIMVTPGRIARTSRGCRFPPV